MTIDWDAKEADAGPTIREGIGWRQTTPEAKNQPRFYNDTAPADESHDETDAKFISVTEALRAGWPTDFTGSTKAFIANNVWDNAQDIASWYDAWRQAVADAGTDAYLLEQAEQYRKDKLREIREYADESLRLAADRGTAVHSYIEDRLNGNIPDWEYIVACRAETWIAAVDKFLADCTPKVVLAEVVCFDRVNEVAGTCDAVVELDYPGLTGTWEIDWKSRT